MQVIKNMGKILIFILFIFLSYPIYGEESNNMFRENQECSMVEVIKGEKEIKIKKYIDVLFVKTGLYKKTEKNLIELLSGYSLYYFDKEGGPHLNTWSSPVDSLNSPVRKLVVVFFSEGSGHYVDFWVLHELKDEIQSFHFKGSEKGCGEWQVINDLDKDGISEIIIKHFIGDYDGSGTIAVWTAIYKWDGKNYIRADEQFPEYYAKYVVPKYQKIIANEKEWSNNERDRYIYRKCKFIFDKALSISKKAKSKLKQ